MRTPSMCEYDCGNAAELRITLATPMGTLLDQTDLCKACATPGLRALTMEPDNLPSDLTGEDNPGTPGVQGGR